MALKRGGGQLYKDGRAKAVTATVIPLGKDRKPFELERVNAYNFNSNMLIPVDTWSLTFKPPVPKFGSKSTYYDQLVMEGDLIRLSMGDDTLATGFVDSTDLQLDVDGGARLTILGRDMLSMLEDNDAVNPVSGIMYIEDAKFDDVMQKLTDGTRINGYEKRNIPGEVSSFFGTMPGESKLAALQRFIDASNSIPWCDPTGKLIIGRPNFAGGARGTLGVRQLEDQRVANVMGIRVLKASAQIPGAVLPIYSGTEGVQKLFPYTRNQAEGPKRMFEANHKVFRTIVWSTPDATNPQQLPDLQRLVDAANTKGNWMAQLAERELRRENVKELIVECSVQGHLNELLEPYAVDTCYNLVWDAANLNRKMYLFSVNYVLSDDGGQVTHLQFCNLDTIVASGVNFTAAVVDNGERIT